MDNLTINWGVFIGLCYGVSILYLVALVLSERLKHKSSTKIDLYGVKFNPTYQSKIGHARFGDTLKCAAHCECSAEKDGMCTNELYLCKFAKKIDTYHSPSDMCKHHKPNEMSYLLWQIWASSQQEKGETQTRCNDCLRYFFPCEMGVKGLPDYKHTPPEPEYVCPNGCGQNGDLGSCQTCWGRQYKPIRDGIDLDTMWRNYCQKYDEENKDEFPNHDAFTTSINNHSK